MKTTPSFAEFVQEQYGVLTKGAHVCESGRACAIEAYNAWRARAWSDTPDGIPDFRVLNDAPWRSEGRLTEAMVPVITRFQDWGQWPPERQKAVAQAIILRTVQTILSTLPHLSEEIRTNCREALTLGAAFEASREIMRTAREAADRASSWVEMENWLAIAEAGGRGTDAIEALGLTDKDTAKWAAQAIWATTDIARIAAEIASAANEIEHDTPLMLMCRHCVACA